MKITFVLLMCFHSGFGLKNYSEYTLFRTVPFNKEQLEYVKGLAERISIDFWLPPGKVWKPIDMLINPVDKKSFMRSMEEKQYNYTTVIDDIQKAFDLQTIKPYIRRKMETFSWTNYYQLDDIYAWMKDLEQNYPNELTIMQLGKTHENRDILGMKIIFRDSSRRSAVIVEGGIHAREWISPAFVTYFLDQLVKSHKKPETPLGKIAQTYEFYIVPVLNPDGYEYSMKSDRNWRKNRYEGYGVDVNRNFDSAYGKTGVSFSKNVETYCGSSAFSEKESQAMRDLGFSVADKLEYYLAFHSYGQYMIIPYAHSVKHTANYDKMYEILKTAQQQLSKNYGTKYSIGTAYDTVGYKTSGISGDWAKKTFLVPYVVTFELRDTGSWGFALPPQQIIPTSVETLDALIYILTPKSTLYKKLSYSGFSKNSVIAPMDTIVIFINILFFIIIRYD